MSLTELSNNEPKHLVNNTKVDTSILLPLIDVSPNFEYTIGKTSLLSSMAWRREKIPDNHDA